MSKILKSISLLLLIGIFIFGNCYAADWSQYESGRNNIRLDGDQGQPGYISFTDGSGTVLGYIWMSSDSTLVWCSAGALDLTTTKLSDTYGLKASLHLDNSAQGLWRP